MKLHFYNGGLNYLICLKWINGWQCKFGEVPFCFKCITKRIFK